MENCAPLTHLHLSLHWLGDYSEVPEHLVHAAGRACEAVVAHMPAFEVKFDRVFSFRGRPGNNPLVLVSEDDGNAALRKLHQQLGAELARYSGLGGGNSRLTPHLTLLYDKQIILGEPIDPVSWIVDEIVLVRSHVGATKYHPLGRWTLNT